MARFVERDVGTRLTSNGLLELQWYLFGVLFLLGAPYTLRRDEHVRVDVLYGGLPRRGKLWTDAVGGLVLLLPFAIFAFVHSLSFAIDSVERGEWSSDPGGLPRWPLKLVLPIGFLLLALQGLSEVIKRLAILQGAEPGSVGLDEDGCRETPGPRDTE